MKKNSFNKIKKAVDRIKLDLSGKNVLVPVSFNQSYLSALIAALANAENIFVKDFRTASKNYTKEIFEKFEIPFNL